MMITQIVIRELIKLVIALTVETDDQIYPR